MLADVWQPTPQAGVWPLLAPESTADHGKLQCAGSPGEVLLFVG